MTNPLSGARRLGGILSALVTPYDHSDAVDVDTLQRLVGFELDQGIAGFYVGGSTGEAFLQTVDERALILKTVAVAARARCQLIAHVGCISTRDSLHLARAAAEAGYDAISAIPPFYYDFSAKELMAHYRTLTAQVPLPLLIYNFGGKVGRLTAVDIMELLDNPRVIGVKHTSQDLYLLERLKHHRPDAVIFNGYDEMCLAGLAMGADGAIGTTYNFMGALFGRLKGEFERGNMQEALRLQRKANRVIDTLIDVGVFPGTKGMLKLSGIDCGACRSPFRALTVAEWAKLEACHAGLQSI